MKRISPSDSVAYRIREKSSAGFVDGFYSSKDVLQPVAIQINDEDAFELYRCNEWLFATINTIVQDCSQVEVDVIPKDINAEIKGALKNRIEYVKAFLDDPNGNKESFREIREKFLRDMLVYGRGTLEKVKRGRLLKEIYTLIAKNLTITTDKHGNLPKKNAYTLSAPNATDEISFDRDEVIFSAFMPVSYTPYGMKPIDVLANSVAADILRAAYNSNYFVNGAEASGILSVPGLNKTDLKKFRQYWESKFKGAAKSHRTFIVNNDKVSWVRMALTNKDMEFTEYGKEIRNKIFAVFHMQPMVMGIVDDTTGKLNSEQQVRIYKNNAIKPILNKESYCYTKEICEDGFGFKDVKITFKGIDLEDRKLEAEIDQIRLNSGSSTINEVRNKYGERPVTWGDTPIVLSPGGAQIDPATGQAIPASEQGGKKPAKPAEKKIYQTEEPTSKNIFDQYMELFKNQFLKNAVEAMNFYSNDRLDVLFDTDNEKTAFKFFIASVKLTRDYFKGNVLEFDKEIDNIITSLKKSVTYFDLFMGARK